jgi:chromosome partitioning protein
MKNRDLHDHYCSVVLQGWNCQNKRLSDIASSLSLFHQKKYLLVDFDSQANLTSSLGFSTDKLETMVPVLQDEKTI